MSNEAKPTPGPCEWKYQPRKRGGYGAQVVDRDGKLVALLEENAHDPNTTGPLIAEAGTVYHETGLTPRQLAEQRAELMRVCQSMRNWMREYHTQNGEAICDDGLHLLDADIAAVLAKCKGGA